MSTYLTVRYLHITSPKNLLASIGTVVKVHNHTTDHVRGDRSGDTQRHWVEARVTLSTLSALGNELCISDENHTTTRSIETKHQWYMQKTT